MREARRARSARSDLVDVRPQGGAGRHGAHGRRRRPARAGRPAEDVERQAAARQDARALRDAASSSSRKSARDVTKLDVVKEAAKSQLEYFKLAVLGGRKTKD